MTRFDRPEIVVQMKEKIQRIGKFLATRVLVGLCAIVFFPHAPAQAQGYQVNVIPADPIPTIPAGDDIILYIHGGPGSRLEEASDLVKPLIEAAPAKGKRYTIISFDQLSQGYSSMVDPNVFLQHLGSSQSASSVGTQAQVTFPITGYRDDDLKNSCFPCVNGHMHSEVTITKNTDGSGNLVGYTTIESYDSVFGFTGGVAAALLDASGTLLWTSSMQTIGVSAGQIRPLVPWPDGTITIPPPKLSQIKYLAIIQKWDPKTLAQDIKSWINAIGNGTDWNQLGTWVVDVAKVLTNTPVTPIDPLKYDYNTLLGFSEESIVAFLKQLDTKFPNLNLLNRNIYIIGGSTGGALALRMGHRGEPWIKKIVAWNPASVWESFATYDAGTLPDFTKVAALYMGFARSEATEGPGSREEYFTQIFGMPTPTTQPNPEEWYRGDRDSYIANNDTYNQVKEPPNGDIYTPSHRTAWDCKRDYIAGARLEHQEIYNPANRRWHWRLGSEMTLFSFFNDQWVGPVPPLSESRMTGAANYLGIRKPTMLVASDDDDWNEGMDGISSLGKTVLDSLLNGVVSGLTAEFSAVTGGKSLPGVVSGSTGAGFPRHWEDRWTRVHVMAPLMQNTPGYTLYVPNTGHSIHNERPNFLANQIVNFLSSVGPTAGPLQVRSIFPESKLSAEKACQKQLPQIPPVFPAIPWQLLDNPGSAKLLMEAAIPRGKFSDGKEAGQYSLRLKPELRAVAHAKNPTNALATAAVTYYMGGNGAILWSNAFADLAVTGRDAYNAFRSHPPTDPEVAAAARIIMPEAPGPKYLDYENCMKKPTCKCTKAVIAKGGKPVFVPCEENPCIASCRKLFPTAFVPLDPPRLETAVQLVLTRAYKVAWALHNSHKAESYQLRSQLGWIAVSGEDDPPSRPVNVPSGIPVFGGPDGTTQVSSYPQYDLPITMCPSPSSPYEPYKWCPLGTAKGVSFQIRYTIASPAPAPPLTINPTATIANPAQQLTQPGISLAGPQMQLPILSASVCLTSDGKNCLPPKALVPVARHAIVIVSSGGQRVGGATVSVSGQNGGALTNASGVAVVNYNGCVSRTTSPVGIPIATPAPCQASATKSGFQAVAISLP
jgi:pimeloyl-ACP methyl ester carboxylesterase